MTLLLGIIIVFSSVIGGFLEAHGKLLSLWQPAEIIIICGAAFGAFVISNPASVIFKALLGPFKLLRIGSYSKSSIIELLSTLYQIGDKVRKKGLMSIEEDIEEPERSQIFAKYPKLLANTRLMNFINDNLRVVISGNTTKYDLEPILDAELEIVEKDLEKPILAINRVADALPGFGIVAAVLGIVVTMQFIGGEPKILGFKVAAALVGTFLGVLLSYGVVGPIATSLEYNVKNEMQYYNCVKFFILNFIAGTSAQIAIEYARRSLLLNIRPDFLELETMIKELRSNKQ